MPSPSRNRSPTKRQLILKAATDVFAAKPYEDVYVSDIARRAGVAHGLVFYYFGDKRGVYLATAKALLSDLSSFAIPPADAPVNEHVIRGILERYFEFARRYPAAMLNLIRFGQYDPELAEEYTRVRQRGVDQILEALGFPADSHTPLLRSGLRAWLGFNEALAADWLLNDQDLPLEDCIDLSVEALKSTVKHIEACSVTVIDPSAPAAGSRRRVSGQ